MSYGSFQGQAQTYFSNHYPAHTQYPSASAPSFSPYQNPLSLAKYPRSSPPAPELPSGPPDLSTVSPQVASQSIRRVLSAELRNAGFDSAHPLALQRLEVEVVAFTEKLYNRAHEYANLANRAGPITTDLMLACGELKLQPKDLYNMRKKSAKKRKRDSAGIFKAPTLVPPPSRSPSPDLLPSDDEGTPPAIPVTLRSLPSYFPSLPPKHTYLRTPASPPKRQALPSLEKKLKTAGLVQDSLRNLLIATEDIENQEDGELLGHIVNWEAAAHPRKRWKV